MTTDEEKRIAVAKACPQIAYICQPRIDGDTSEKTCIFWCLGTPYANKRFDPLNDLNAMHEVEKTLSDDQFYVYKELVSTATYEAIKNLRPMPKIFRPISATARQRTDAFLKIRAAKDLEIL